MGEGVKEEENLQIVGNEGTDSDLDFINNARAVHWPITHLFI